MTILVFAAALLAFPVGASASPDSKGSGGGAAMLRERAAELASRGDFAGAAEVWSELARRSERAGDSRARESALIELAEAQLASGRAEDALASAQAAEVSADAAGDPVRRARARATLGSVYARLGESAKAEAQLAGALEAATAAGAWDLAAAVTLNLGSVRAVEGRYEQAFARFREADALAERAGRDDLRARALTNASRAASDRGDAAAARESADAALALALTLPDSHHKAVLLLNLASSWEGLRAEQPGDEALLLRSHEVLSHANRAAYAAGDRRSGAWAAGRLALLYEERGRLPEAVELTRRALGRARAAEARDMEWRWHGQLGRLLAASGERNAAIDEYAVAVADLQELRPFLESSRQGSFERDIRPAYLGLADLLLQRAAHAADPEAEAADLRAARDTVERFKAAELRNYFRDECVDAYQEKQTGVAQVSGSARVIYPISLPDRLVLLVSSAGSIRQVAVPVPADRLATEVHAFRRLLEERQTFRFMRRSRQLYDWLVRPIEPQLRKAEVETLVFVPGGALRTIPPAALHDGERFLVERYALAVTPGLELTDPRPIDREVMRVFLAGISQSVQGFPALPHVEAEVESIASLYRSESLMNDAFVQANLAEKLAAKPFSVVHIASHSSFRGDNQETFLLTYDDRMSLDQLAGYVGRFRYRDRPLELLTLSACETARGDERAALGLAGIAVKSGARSALGSLWNVNDEASAELVAEFYRQLRGDGVSRAEALRRAQLGLLGDLRFRHPGYWSAFVMISNWL